MSVARWQGLVLGIAAGLAALPGHANRLTLEVWPDNSPDHTVSCTFALYDGWISLLQVTGAGMPGPNPMRWRASNAEVEALSVSLQAFVVGSLGSVDPYQSRLPPAPFLSVTWMTQVDDRLATGLYIQPGLTLPGPLADTLASLGVARTCGLTARTDE
ncbi:MAG TPA: hypothetical protein VK146_02230 [Tabrizicola sp.]|nr:hypothetical protein [Tabrizicola sp.]